jgi:hypothetical protein
MHQLNVPYAHAKSQYVCVCSWDRHPLQVDAQAYKVLIEGDLVADNSAFASAIVAPPPAGNATLEFAGPSACKNVRHTQTNDHTGAACHTLVLIRLH